ncbi:MAG: IgA Peptidase M64 [Bacteroidales bacterium]
MKRYLLILVPVILLSCNAPRKPAETAKVATETPVAQVLAIDKGNVTFDDYFLDKTMRLDYFHTGTAKEEIFSPDRIVSDGSWPGSKNILVDPLELGLYLFEIADKKSNMLLYSRGFASVFGEWQTTPEAELGYGTFHESIRFPWPKNPVNVIMKKRDTANVFQIIWTTSIDPASRKVNPADLAHTEKVSVIYDNGLAAEKLDIVILGDGYTASEMGKFEKDAKRMADVLMDHEPFLTRKKDINIRAVETPSEVSGVSRPHPGVFKRTALSAHYGSFDSERYVLSYDNRTIRDVASAVPYDFMVILINERTYGGGGIYNLYTTVSADNKLGEYIMVHEFGHHLGALADEYYTSSIAYEMPEIKVEPWEVNITALFDKNSLKWKDLVEAGTPIPTPWNKEPFDQFGYRIQQERDSLRAAKVPEEIMEALFMRQMKQEDEYFAAEQYRDKVGAFEGAGYLAKGLYRSQIDCIMYTRHMQFCKVCRRGLEDVIDMYSK